MNWLNKLYCATRSTKLGGESEVMAVMLLVTTIWLFIDGVSVVLQMLNIVENDLAAISSKHGVIIALIIGVFVGFIISFLCDIDWDKKKMNAFNSLPNYSRRNAIFMAHTIHYAWIVLFLLVVLFRIIHGAYSLL
jgi:uncharacterized protein YacL